MSERARRRTDARPPRSAAIPPMPPVPGLAPLPGAAPFGAPPAPSQPPAAAAPYPGAAQPGTVPAAPWPGAAPATPPATGLPAPHGGALPPFPGAFQPAAPAYPGHPGAFSAPAPGSVPPGQPGPLPGGPRSVHPGTPATRPRGAAHPPARNATAAYQAVAAQPGARLAGFTIDVLGTLAVAAGIGLASGSMLLAVVVAVELALFGWVLEARTGATPGALLVGIRTARVDRPDSPGALRALGRGLVRGAGFLVAGVGAWIVEGSAAWDRDRRGWADRAAGTVVVAVPRGARAAALEPARILPAPVPLGPPAAGVTGIAGVLASVPSLDAPAGRLGAPVVRAAAAGTGEPGLARTGAPAEAVQRGPVPAAVAGPGSYAPLAPAEHPPVPAGLVAGPPAQPAGSASGASAAPAHPAAATLLLVFDTGQRVQLPTPVAVNLGRNPAPSEADDRLIAVDDPESSVSKTHARLEHARGRTWITDAGSTNGTRLIGEDGDVSVLPAGNRVLLDEGTRVRLGNRAFTVSLLLTAESNE